MLKKPDMPAGKVQQPAEPDPKFVKVAPMLWSYLNDDTYEGGVKRETATLTIFVDDGRLKGCLNDRDNNRTGWASSDTLEGLLKALEKDLTADTMEWRTAAGAKRKRS